MVTVPTYRLLIIFNLARVFA